MEHDKHLSAPSAVVVRGTEPRRKDPIEEDIAFCKLITLLSPRTSRVRTMPPSLIKKKPANHSFAFILPITTAEHTYTCDCSYNKYGNNHI